LVAFCLDWGLLTTKWYKDMGNNEDSRLKKKMTISAKFRKKNFYHPI
jgi:hypothetical protein